LEFNFRRIRIIFIIPVFLGVFCSLFLGVFIGAANGFFKRPAPVIAAGAVEFQKEEYDDSTLLFDSSEDIVDPILIYYRDPGYCEWVINFFEGICSNIDIAKAILESADQFNVSPALALALCWEESRFNPNAINRRNRNGSIDRGLFQLNDRSFPSLELAGFYSVKSNTQHGISHLRFCLDSSDTEISALAMYNAGTGRVRSTGAPEVTLNYISRILENRQKIESRFLSRLIKEEEYRLTEKTLSEPSVQPKTNRALITTSPL